MTLHRPLNAFGYLLQELCERQGRSIHDVARSARLSGVSRMYYAISAKAPGKRSTPLTEEELTRIARALKLDVEGEERLIIAAQLAAAPPRLRKYVRQLEECNSVGKKGPLSQGPSTH